MAEIDTKGMKVAELTTEQFNQLRDAEKKMNEAPHKTEEIYLLAVTRP